MDKIQKVLVKAGRKDLAQKYYKKVAAEKWIQDVVEAPKFQEGALRKYFGLNKDEKITKTMINNELKSLKGKYKDGESYSKSDLKLLRRLQFAKNVI